MPQSSYAYAVGRIRALENSLLNAEKIERMIESQSIQDAAKILADMGFNPGMAAENNQESYEAFLKSEMKQTADLIREISPNPGLTDLFLLKYDFHNLKVLFKTRILNIDGNYLLSETGTVPVEILKAAVLSNNYLQLPDFIKEAVLEIENVLSVKTDPQKIDLKLDMAMFKYIASECGRLNNDFVSGYFERLVDLLNIKTLIRIKKMGEGTELLKESVLPFGMYPYSFYTKAFEESYERLLESLSYSRYADAAVAGLQNFLRTGKLSLFEKLADDHLMRYIKSNKHNPFGIEPIVGFLAAKETETRLIRAIMIGKFNNVSSDKIRERLRDMYV